MNRFFLFLLLVLLLSSASPAQEMPVPVDVQYQLLKKILSFDRNLRTRCGDTLVIGIAFQTRYRTSLNIKEEFLHEFDAQTPSKIENIPLVCSTYEVVSASELENILSKDPIDILYITPLRGINIEQVTTICQKKNVLTFTGIPEYVTSGIVVGIDIKGENPQILINLPSAKATNIDFNSQLLKLSKIVE